MQRISFINTQLTTAQGTTEPTTISYAGKNDCIGILTLYNKSSYNALVKPMRESLARNLKELEYNNNVKVVCIRSIHPKVFCAGANIKSFETASNASWIIEDRFKEFDLIFRNFNKPIITAVNKLALGGGFEIALHSDIILATEDAQFGLPEIKLGLFPGIGGTLIAKTIGK
jgi:enoyl-CoA hydratase/carnithine racemase